MPLTEVKLRTMRAAPTAGKHGDKDGLYVRIDAKGAMRWQWRIRTPKGENIVSYGVYPEVGLAEARERHRTARQQIREGINPNEAKREAKTEQAPVSNAFEAVAREWFDTRRQDWSDSYGEKIMRRLEVDVFPYIGEQAADSVTPPQLLSVLRRIEARGVVETAHRALENCGQVFRFAIAIGKAERNPAADLKDALRKPTVKHFPAITEPKRLGELLRACANYQGTPVVRAALALAPMLLLRPGELRFAVWDEFDLNAATWTVPAMRMKREKAGKLHGQPHIVALPTQAVAILRDLHFLTGRSPYVFRGERHHHRAMSENTVNAALRAMGFPGDEVTGHGFRATARTMLAERLGLPIEVVEAQLAHSVKDSLGRAYNRTEYLKQRRQMLQTWADYLDQLREDVNTVSEKD